MCPTPFQESRKKKRKGKKAKVLSGETREGVVPSFLAGISIRVKKKRRMLKSEGESEGVPV